MRLGSGFAYFSLYILWGCSNLYSPHEKQTVLEYGHDINNVDLRSFPILPITPSFFRHRSLSYSIEVPHFLDVQSTMQETDEAFRAWEQHAQGKLRFFRSEGTAHIQIRFLAPDHRDDCDAGFTNPNTTIAHAFDSGSPCLVGNIHLNRNILWVLNGATAWPGSGRFDLRTVLIHEIGHALGFKLHTQDTHSVMNGQYLGIKRQLADIDVRQFLQIYGQ